MIVITNNGPYSKAALVVQQSGENQEGVIIGLHSPKSRDIVITFQTPSGESICSILGENGKFTPYSPSSAANLASGIAPDGSVRVCAAIFAYCIALSENSGDCGTSCFNCALSGFRCLDCIPCFFCAGTFFVQCYPEYKACRAS